MNLITQAGHADPITSELLLSLLGLRATPPPPPGSCARRMAELLERRGLEDQAAAWWRRAANLGGRDAQDYVATFVDEPDCC